MQLSCYFSAITTYYGKKHFIIVMIVLTYNFSVIIILSPKFLLNNLFIVLQNYYSRICTNKTKIFAESQ